MRTWLESVSDLEQWLQTFDVLPSVYFYCKNLEHKFQRVNQAFAEKHGCAHPSEVIGLCDADFHTPAMAAQYVEEDKRVMAAGKPLTEQIWLVPDVRGIPHWYASSKFPLRDRSGNIAGIAGVMRRFDGAGSGQGTYARLTPAMDHVLKHYNEDLQIHDLAQRCHLSESQFQREFQRCFQMTPGNYLLSVRLLLAKQRLSDSDDPIGSVALDCGFYDQSHFTRSFQKANGLSPGAYRRTHRNPQRKINAT